MRFISQLIGWLGGGATIVALGTFVANYVDPAWVERKFGIDIVTFAVTKKMDVEKDERIVTFFVKCEDSRRVNNAICEFNADRNISAVVPREISMSDSNFSCKASPENERGKFIDKEIISATIYIACIKPGVLASIWPAVALPRRK